MSRKMWAQNVHCNSCSVTCSPILLKVSGFVHWKTLETRDEVVLQHVCVTLRGHSSSISTFVLKEVRTDNGDVTIVVLLK